MDEIIDKIENRIKHLENIFDETKNVELKEHICTQIQVLSTLNTALISDHSEKKEDKPQTLEEMLNDLKDQILGLAEQYEIDKDEDIEDERISYFANGLVALSMKLKDSSFNRDYKNGYVQAMEDIHKIFSELYHE